MLDYFGERYWRNADLVACVACGLQLEKERKQPFSWLTCTNAGASEVCEAVLRLIGITQADLDQGYYCDPTTKSNLRMVAKPGVIIRLSRNFDKQRGFVNGALAEICESLRGNEVFTARLVGSGNMVLVHPTEEKGEKFLPCCYGYATTIRRAQGADLFHGAIYFEQKKFPAARGYAYVACSRFKSRHGVYLYGKLRRSDFLPVGPTKETDQIERGYESDSSDGSNYSGGLEHAHRDSDDDLDYELPSGPDEGLILSDFGAL